jgi:acyl-CoA synthetase (AMP-forming)/AMP-acid ligase II
MLADTVECLEVVFALWRAGLVVVPVDRLWGQGLQAQVLSMSGAATVINCEPDGSVRQSPAATAAPRLDPEVAIISYTSGSTSDPKGVVLRHRHLRAVYAAGVRAVRALGVETPERFGCSMRLSGLGVMGVHYLFALEWGATTVTLPELSMLNAGGYWDQLGRHHIDMTYWVRRRINSSRAGTQ